MADVNNIKSVQGSPMPGLVGVVCKALFTDDGLPTGTPDGTAKNLITDGGGTMSDYAFATGVTITLDEPYSQLVGISGSVIHTSADADDTNELFNVSLVSEDVDNVTTPTVTVTPVQGDGANPADESLMVSMAVVLWLRNDPA